MKIWRVVNVKADGSAALNKSWQWPDATFQRFLTESERERPVILNLPDLVVREADLMGTQFQIFFPEER